MGKHRNRFFIVKGKKSFSYNFSIELYTIYLKNYIEGKNFISNKNLFLDFNVKLSLSVYIELIIYYVSFRLSGKPAAGDVRYRSEATPERSDS